MSNSNKKKIRVVIVGGGFGGAYALKALHKRLSGPKHPSITLVNPHNYFLFTPLLHEVATGGVSPENVVEPLRKLLECSRADLLVARATHVDLKRRIVETTEGNVPYDYLVLALGSKTRFFNVPGARDHSFTLKTFEDALRFKDHCIAVFEQASKARTKQERTGLLTFVVVGGGATGVEAATEMAEFFEDLCTFYPTQIECSDIRIIIFQKDSALLPKFPGPLQKKGAAVLKKKNIKIQLETAISAVGSDFVALESGKRIATHTVLWVAGIRPQSISFNAHVAKEKERGCLVVEKTLQLKGQTRVFVVGDMGFCEAAPLPALAQVAVQQGRHAAKNIDRLIEGKTARSFRYRHKGDLVSLGQWHAVAHIGGLLLSGRFTWILWRGVYWSKLLSWQKRIRVGFDWLMDAFSKRDISTSK